MHKRLLNITYKPLKRYTCSNLAQLPRCFNSVNLKVPRCYYAENSKPDPRLNPVERNPFEKKVVEVDRDAIAPEPIASVPEQLIQGQAALDEREQIKKLRQQIKKRDTDDPLGITTVIKKKSILDHIKEGIASIKKSLKDLYKDGQYVYGLKKQKGSWKNLYLVEYIKYKNINYDLIKFLPYSFFLVVPFAEFALPFYILLLPNSTPTQFYSEKTIGERTQKMILKQKDGYEVIKTKLYTVFGNDFLAIKQKCDILRENPGDKDTLEKLRALDAKIQQRLREEWDASLSKKLGFYNLSIEEKEALLKVFYIEYISGVYIINQLYNLPFMVYNFASKYLKTNKVDIDVEKWKLNFFPIRHLKALGYKVQLVRHLHRIRKEDRLLMKNTQDELDRCSSIELFELIRKRGFKIESDTDSKEFLAKYWTKHAEIKNTDIKVWSIMIRHYYGDYLV